MEEQYLPISEKQAKKLRRLGFKPYTLTSKKPGQEKIINYVINLSEILSYLENNYELLEKIKQKNKELEKIDQEIKNLKEKIKTKKKALE
ncbi:hypothetical protein GF386_02525 [Candidatus Pacearchaeota archaeon]|nr:hypothetical protein [Candidatus Pacearchaeota archaeon]MBD3283019.1 hypothetical protein [Candidatus Pacearchaeota archaeon]